MASAAQFFRNTVVLMGATAVGQILALLAAPILTRLYQPAEFGVFAAVAAAAAILSIVSTMRYELAIVLPEREIDAAALALISVISTLAVTIGALLLPWLTAAAGGSLGKLSGYWWAVPPLALLMASTQILNCIANRHRAYVAIATGVMFQQAGTAAFSILIAVLALMPDGLVVGRLAGQLCAVAAIALLLRQAVRMKGSLDWGLIRQVAMRYRQFPIFNVPYSLFGTISKEFIVLAFTSTGHLTAVGYYGLARTVLTAPISFLSSSLSQVFYKEAATGIGTPAFERLMLDLLRGIALVLAPLFVFAWFWSPLAFELIFGAKWREAGQYASVLMPIALLSLFTSWPERIFEIRNKQHYALGIQATFDLSSLLVVLLLLAGGYAELTVVRAYVTIQIGYHLSYLTAVFVFSGLGVNRLLNFLALLALSVGGALLVQLPILRYWSQGLEGMLIGALAACALAAPSGIFFVQRRLRA